MSVVDLHPEDLLDKDALGTLAEGERARLEAHVAHCSACRFERQLRADFAADLENDWQVISSVGSLALEAMPATGGKASEIAKSGPLPLARPARRRRTRLVWLFAAAVLLVGGAAAAMNGLGERPWSRFVRTEAAPTMVTPPPEAPHAKPHHVLAVAPPEPTVAPEPVVSAPAPVHPVVHVAHVSPATPAAAPAPVHVVGPGELFEAASDARRRGDYAHVLEADRQLEDRFPTSREAQVLRAVVGRNLLDRGDASGALGRFDAYLAAGGGDLAEDAMVGRATALDRLARKDEATRAWTTLLATFPATPYAAHAKARLETSNGP
jgi:TolA-binding protein